MMLSLTDAAGLGGIAFALSLIMLAALQNLPLKRAQQYSLITLVFILLLIPFEGSLSLTGYVRGITGDLSITSLVLLGMRQCSQTPQTKDEQHLSQALIILAACTLYPMALGVGLYDPYRWGYAGVGLLLILAVITLGSALRRARHVQWSITLAVLAWVIGIYESPNLWDYLIDPFITLFALSRLSKDACTSLWLFIRKNTVRE